MRRRGEQQCSRADIRTDGVLVLDPVGVGDRNHELVHLSEAAADGAST
jgi:hypothetical protein